MTYRALKALFALIVVSGMALPAAAQVDDNQARIDNAALIFERMVTHEERTVLRNTLKSAKAVMIFPSVLKAAFIFGAEGGNGVLLARDSDGIWSDPAFYTLGSGSFGFQAGVQDAEVILVIMTERGLDAVIANNAKLGVDASIALGPVGGGLEGATTTNFGGDIAVFTRNVGLFGGLSLEGSVIYEREDHEAAYYGTEDATARTIVIERKFTHDGAQKLKALVAKHTQ